MSVFRTVKHFINGLSEPLAENGSAARFAGEPEPPSCTNSDWETTKGRLHSPRQDRKVFYRNSEISGICKGSIGEVTGSLMVSLFEDLPSGLPYLLIRVTVRADKGFAAGTYRHHHQHLHSRYARMHSRAGQ